jgi:TonB-linked SusC/RagA family outer membrane protein
MRKMYLLSVLITILQLCSFTPIMGQLFPGEKKITIQATTPTLREVLSVIQEQAKVYFYHEGIDVSEIIKVRLVDISLENAMRLIFMGKDIRWKYKDNVVELLKGKSVKVTGVVVDKKGNPIPGATVFLKDGKKGDATDSMGKFSFSDIPFHSILRVSSIGFNPQNIKVTDMQASVCVVLDSAVNEMSVFELFSTGYEQGIKKNSTSSITLIDNNRFNEPGGTNVLPRLGYITGLNTMPSNLVTSGTGITIRGLSTVSGPKEPLIILDDFPYNGALENINPNDIESISVLKDAAAASIWGVRAGNGVIVITTKKGKYEQEINITLNANITFIPKPDLFSMKSMRADDFITVERNLFDSGFYDARLPHPSYYVLTPAVHIFSQEKAGLISEGEANTQLDRLRNIDVRNEFDNRFYVTGVNQQYAINISGGTKTHAWMASGGFDNNLDNLRAIYKRYTARFNNAYKIGDKIELKTNFFLTKSERGNGATAYTSYRPAQLPIYTKLSDPLYTYGNYRDTYIDTVGGGLLLDWRYHPLEDYKHTIDRLHIQEVNAEISLKYKIKKYLSFSLLYRYQNQKTERNFYQDRQSYYTRDLINRFSEVNYSRRTVKYNVPLGGILDVANNNETGKDLRGQMAFSKIFNRHAITAIAGGQISEVLARENTSRNYGFDEDIYSNSIVDFVNKYPHFITGNPENIPNTSLIDESIRRIVSVYANASYLFNSKYGASVGARRDATNSFGLKTRDKWKPLWSSGISWLISEETFYKDRLFTYLKLRITYGESGNVDPKKVAQTTIRFDGINTSLNTPYSRIDNSYDPELRWEQVGMWNVGLDFSVKNNRLSGSIEFYRKKMTDLYGESAVDITTGLGRNTVMKNVGKMSGKGIDIELNSLNTSGAFTWNSDLIFSFNRDKVLQLKNKDKLTPQHITGGTAVGLEDYPAYAYFAYRSTGLDPQTGDPRGMLNGLPSTDYQEILGSGTRIEDLMFIGGLLPAFYGSLGNTLSWKGITLTARITYKFDYYFRRQSISYDDLYYLMVGHSDFSKRWQKAGDELHTTVPSMTYPVKSGRDQFYDHSDVLAVRGDHIRLQYIHLGYAMNKLRFAGNNCQKIQCYIILNNLGILWRANKEKIDPEHQTMDVARNVTVGTRIFF